MKFVGVPRKGHQSMDPQSKDSWERALRKHLTEFIFLVIFLRLHTLCTTFMTGEKSHQSMDRHFIWGKLQEDITEASNQAHVSCHFSSLTHCVHYLYDRRKKVTKAWTDILPEESWERTSRKQLTTCSFSLSFFSVCTTEQGPLASIL